MTSASYLDRRSRALVLGCFFMSGAAGLAYQAIWFRQLQALFGVTAQALAVVVAAFMAGLAAGSWIVGAIADRHPNPLRLYGWLEIGVGVSALLVTPLLWLVERIYVGLHPALADSGPMLAIARTLLALVALVVPTMLMGGTLPALAVLWRRAAAGDDATGGDAGVRSDLARLYGINTAGAVVGTALVGFVLLERVGLRATTWIAALANMGIGVACVRWGLGTEKTDSLGKAREISATPATPAWDWAPPAWYWAFAVSGALALANEVAWTRALTQLIGSSTYAFSLILCAFLAGIALGSLAFARWRRAAGGGFWGFGIAQLAIAVGSALVLPVFVRLPDLQLRAFAHVQDAQTVLVLQFVLCAVVVLLPTLAMGATFPLAAGVAAAGRRDVGAAIGRLYAGNTIGAIVGALAAGFILLPRLGTQPTLVMTMLGNLALAAFAFALARRRRRLPPRRTVAAVLVALAAAAIAIATPRWDPYALDAGIAIGGPASVRGDPALRVRDIARGSDIVFYREGMNANISVRKDETQFYLKTNGKTDGTSRGDMPTQLMLGLLPALVHPQPLRGLVIGLGTGASASAALRPVELQRLDVVEIEPAVIEAARQWFAAVNANVFSDPRLHLAVDDARAFLRTGRGNYDFIVSEPSNPWIAGVANLFAVDHYRRCAERLAADGIVAQWLQIYAMRPELVQMVLASMHTVFPHLQVWSFHHGDLIVLASRAPLPAFDVAAANARLDAWGVRDQAHEVLDIDSAAGLLGFFLLGSDDAAAFAAGAELNTDDRPRLEFAAPRSLYLSTRDSNAELLNQARRADLPPLAAGWQPSGGEALDIARAARASRRLGDAARWLERAGSEGSVSRVAWELEAGRLALARGQPERAVQIFAATLQHAPDTLPAAQELARLRFMQGRTPEGLALVATACAPAAFRERQTADLALQLLEAAVERGDIRNAVDVIERLLPAADTAALDPVLHARLWAIAARVAAAERDSETASSAARRALELNAQCTLAWRVLGTLAFEAERWPEAVQWWERLVEYRQTGADLLVPLAMAYQRTGRLADARRAVRRALTEEPQHRAALRLRDELGA